jgi:hypothetical protein
MAVGSIAEHMNLKPAQFLIPAAFLFLLGTGNLAVGTFKRSQYEDVLTELALFETLPGLNRSSSLRRVQVSKQTTHRLNERQDKAQARVDMYRLVEFSGKLFLTIALLTLILGFGALYAQHTWRPTKF